MALSLSLKISTTVTRIDLDKEPKRETVSSHDIYPTLYFIMSTSRPLQMGFKYKNVHKSGVVKLPKCLKSTLANTGYNLARACPIFCMDLVKWVVLKKVALQILGP